MAESNPYVGDVGPVGESGPLAGLVGGIDEAPVPPVDPVVVEPTDNAIADRAWLLVSATGLVGYDTTSDRLLEGLVRGVLAPAQRMSLIAHGDATRGPWDIITDPAKAELWSLPYAAQWVGGTVPPRRSGEPYADYLERARVEAGRPRGIYRGSATSLLQVAKPFLRDGHAEVRIVENVNGDRFQNYFVARGGDITDQAGLAAALNDPSVVPAGSRVDLVASDAPIIEEWTRTIDAVTATIDSATIADVT